MFIDTLFLIAFVTAVFKGYSKGLIIAIFSFVAIFIGLAAAFKLSAVVANWLQTNTGISSNWLPFLSFTITMIGVIILVRFGAKMVQKTIEFAFLGWVNKLGGVLLYCLLYISFLSIVLFYIVKMGLLTQNQVNDSVTYPFFKEWGHVAIDVFSWILPFLKDAYSNLENFFHQKATAII